MSIAPTTEQGLSTTLLFFTRVGIVYPLRSARLPKGMLPTVHVERGDVQKGDITLLLDLEL